MYVYSKAIKHYMLDLCICPERFDSWAGMALARHSRLENKLSAVCSLCIIYIHGHPHFFRGGQIHWHSQDFLCRFALFPHN